MKVLNHSFLIFVLFIFLQSLFAQEIVLKGKVRHANTYEEISRVNIYLKNTKLGTTSNSNGDFLLKVSQPQENAILIFKHIKYHTLELALTKAQNQDIFYLLPRVIQLPEIKVEAEKARSNIQKDLPQPVSIIAAKSFDTRGYVDAGDLLRTEQSVQVKEELSGKKTISIRGGNPDDVIVLYNGIKLNNTYDNIFDLSLINLEDVEQLEIIRGSNTALYGADAVSGIINIVPKTQKNYTIRLQQKFGSYAAGYWNLQLNRNFFKRLNLSYSYKQGSMARDYSQSKDFLENKNSYHYASLVYDISKNDQENKNLNLMYLRSNLDYKNIRYNETMANFNQMVSLCYLGNIGIIKKLNLVGSYQWLDNKQFLSTDTLLLDWHILNRSFNFNAEKSFEIKNLELLLGYQFEDSELDFKDEREIPGEQSIGIGSALLKRQKHGLVSIIKLHVPTGSKFYKTTDFDISYRRDIINNQYHDISFRQPTQQMTTYEAANFNDNNWDQSMLKISNHLSGISKYLIFNSYINFSTNYKFPTMFQQIGSPLTSASSPKITQPVLMPQKNTNVEVAIDLIKETPKDPTINGWQISVNYFRNYYDNKIITYYLPYVPIVYYENVQNVEISGLESKASFFMIKHKLTVEFVTSFYSISDKAAFPFKTDKKYIINILLDHAGYSFQLHGFNESDQLGWVRDLNGEFSEVSLPGYSNIDIHLSKMFEFYKFKIFANFSGRNLLDDDTRIEGLTLRDRRFYFTIGIQY